LPARASEEAGRRSFHFELGALRREQCLLKGRFHATSGQARWDVSTTRSIPVPSPRPGSGQGRSSSRRIEERSLLSFQRPVPRRKERRKKSLRLAPGGLRGCES